MAKNLLVWSTSIINWGILKSKLTVPPRDAALSLLKSGKLHDKNETSGWFIRAVSNREITRQRAVSNILLAGSQIFILNSCLD
jgi:hypothetical protein